MLYMLGCNLPTRAKPGAAGGEPPRWLDAWMPLLHGMSAVCRDSRSGNMPRVPFDLYLIARTCMVPIITHPIVCLHASSELR